MLKKELFGKFAEQEVYRYTLENKNLIRVSILDYGATIQKLIVPDKHGIFRDVVLGYPTIEQYLDNPPHLGACVAPNANRICKGVCPINDVNYQLEINNGVNNCHTSRSVAADHVMYDVQVKEDEELVFSTSFEHMQAGLPGNRQFKVSYKLTDNNRLEIKYWFVSDMDTIFNPTNHSYFNLAGHRSGNVFEQLLKINADYYTPVDETSIPTGEIASVKNTPFDFNHFKEIGRDFDLTNEQLAKTGGYDHNFIIRGYDGTVKEFARVFDEDTARMMICYTDMPAVQVYTANKLANVDGKHGITYQPHAGLCLETQFYPDAPNHANFPSTLVKANEEKSYYTAYEFILG